MEIVCISHKSCNDGMSAYWAVAKKFGRYNVDHRPMAHEDDIDPQLLKDKVVYIVDFSFPPEVMDEIAKYAKEVTLLDHHKSAMERLGNKSYPNVEMIFDMDNCGAIVTWNYLFPDEEIPVMLRYVCDRDLGKMEMKDVEEVTLYLFSLRHDFDTWNEAMNLQIGTKAWESMISEGKTLKRKLYHDINVMIKDKMVGYLPYKDSYIFLTNVPKFYGSDMCRVLLEEFRDEANPELLAIYYFVNGYGVYEFGVRSDERGDSAREFAEMFGGGGHEFAAGFSTKSIDEFFHTLEEEGLI